MGPIGSFLSGVDFNDFLLGLQQGGWYSIVFPFMLVYAVIYTILNYIKIFEDRKGVKVVISLIFALFSIAYPINSGSYCSSGYNAILGNGGCSLGGLMMTLFPGVTAVSIGILALYIIVAMLGIDITSFFGNDDERNNYIKYAVGVIGLLVVAYYFALGFGWEGFGSTSWLSDLLSDPFLYIIVVFIVFFIWISNDESDEEKEVRKKLREKKKKKHEVKGGSVEIE